MYNRYEYAKRIGKHPKKVLTEVPSKNLQESEVLTEEKVNVAIPVEEETTEQNTPEVAETAETSKKRESRKKQTENIEISPNSQEAESDKGESSNV